MSDLIVCQALLNSGSLSTGGPEVSRSHQGCLSSSVSPRGRRGGGGASGGGMPGREILVGDRKVGKKQTGKVMTITDPPIPLPNY